MQGRDPDLVLANARLVLAGEVVIGGKQDRVLTEDIVLAASETQQVAVNCVEQGRWAPSTTMTPQTNDVRIMDGLPYRAARTL